MDNTSLPKSSEDALLDDLNNIFESTKQKLIKDLQESITKEITKSMQELADNITKGIRDGIKIYLRKPLNRPTNFLPANEISNESETPLKNKPNADDIHKISTKFQSDAHDSPSENEVILRLKSAKNEARHSNTNDSSNKNYYFQWLQFMNKPKFIQSNRHDQNRRSTNFITIFDPGTNTNNCVIDTITE